MGRTRGKKAVKMKWTDLSEIYRAALLRVIAEEDVQGAIYDELIDYGYLTYSRKSELSYVLSKEGQALYDGKEEAEAEELKRSKGFWIIITAKLPTNPSPPKLSIHWAVPWPLDQSKIDDQVKRSVYLDNENMGDEYFWNDSPGGQPWGKEPNVRLPVKIHYKDNDIRVWKHEFNYLTPDRMRDYVTGGDTGGDATHILMEGTKSDQALLRAAMDTDLRGIYDAALIDGCNPEMAKLLAMGMEFNDEVLEFPPICWYKLHPQLTGYYMDESEAAE